MAHPQAARTLCRSATPLAGGNTSGPAKPVPRCSWLEYPFFSEGTFHEAV